MQQELSVDAYVEMVNSHQKPVQLEGIQGLKKLVLKHQNGNII